MTDSFPKFLRLPGIETQASAIPSSCSECGCKDLFRQHDFNRGIGVWIVGIASVLTFVLLGMNYNWFVVWSPMLVVLILDRFIMARLAPWVVVCYECEHLYRGIPQDQVMKLDAFDLDVFDRNQYARRTADEAGPGPTA